MHTATRPNVLIVNDDPASLLALSQVLAASAEQLGYHIITARSGKEALREVLLRRFAVILLDVNMPGMDGFETAATIQSRAVSSDTPIIFITAYMADEVSKLNAYRHHAADFLFSPVIPAVLCAKVAVFVSLASKNEELVVQAERLAQQSQAIAEANARLVIEMQEREVAENANRAKDGFLAMLSHELRNPLAAIKNAGAVLNLPVVTDELAAQAHAIIKRQTAHLRDMVSEILDLSRARSGKIQLSRETLDLGSLVSSCVEKFVASNRTAHHGLTLNLASVQVDGDRTRLLQVVGHLMENALKYTPAGGHVTIETREEQGEAVLTVTDTGAGIPAEQLPSVFDVFSQGVVALDRSHGGLGIGLAIVQCLVSLHDGVVSVHSEGVGRGAMFAVRLPVAIPAAQEARAPVPDRDIAARSN